uniref:Uncharacterized protein n=1 Tax=Janibacter limosus TaxID=53458 RepID=A0AC61U300_9MICO|nr:hypothetical protein [Janibacter limosus]
MADRSVPALGGSRTPADGQRHPDFDDPASPDLTGVSTLVPVSAGYAEDDQSSPGIGPFLMPLSVTACCM